jgi:hypothetical protein
MAELDLSSKTILIFDASAGFTHMAEAVVGQFNRVLYYSLWDQGFPTVKNFIPGTGLDDIERVEDFFDALDAADLVVFTDVGNAGLQEYLRRQGMPVFGSGYADKLERDRWYLKSVCKRYQLNCADAIPVTGIENLRNILGAMGDDEVHVKLSTFRGDAETFKHENAADTTRRLNELSLAMEPYGDHVDFVVEQPIEGEPCVEIGADLPVNVAGLYPQRVLWGYEAKDEAYAGRVGALPQRLRTVCDKLAPILERLNYRGPMCEETRETAEGSFLLDFTARFGSPPSGLQRFMIANWGEIMWEGAHGRVVEPEWLAPIGVEIILGSEYAAKNPLRVTAGRWDRVILHGHCSYNGDDYAVCPSENPEFGSAIGMGATLEQALEDAYDAADEVKARDLEWDAGSLERLTEAIETGEKLGIKWE